DQIRDLLPRVVTPPAVAMVVIATAVVVEWVLLPSAGVVLAALAIVGAFVAVLAQWYADRRATILQANAQRDVHHRVLALLDGAAELMAFGRLRRHHAALTAADERLTQLGRRAALADGLATAVVTAATGVASVLCSWFAAGAVSAGQLDPLLAVPIGLIPLALVEAMALLPPVAVHAPVLQAARRRGSARGRPGRRSSAVTGRSSSGPPTSGGRSRPRPCSATSTCTSHPARTSRSSDARVPESPRWSRHWPDSCQLSTARRSSR